MSDNEPDTYEQLKSNAFRIFVVLLSQKSEFSSLAARMQEPAIQSHVSELFEATLLHQLTYQNDLTRNTKPTSNIIAYRDFFTKENLADAAAAFKKAEQLHGIATVAISQASSVAGLAAVQAATAIAIAKESSKRKP